MECAIRGSAMSDCFSTVMHWLPRGGATPHTPRSHKHRHWYGQNALCCACVTAHHQKGQKRQTTFERPHHPFLGTTHKSNYIHIGMPPTTSLVGHGPQSFADMNNLLKAPITEAAYVPPLYAHNQMSSEEILMKMTNAEQEGRDVDLVLLKEDHRRAYNREAMRKKRAMDNE